MISKQTFGSINLSAGQSASGESGDIRCPFIPKNEICLKIQSCCSPPNETVE